MRLFLLFLLLTPSLAVAQETRSTFQTGVTTNLPDNTSGDISPADLRGEFTDLSNSALFLLDDFASEAEVFTGTETAKAVAPAELKPYECWQYALSDESTALTTGTKIVFRAPYAFNVDEVIFTTKVAHSGGTMTFDVEEDGVSLFSTNPTIDSAEETTSTAATAQVINNAVIDADDEVDIDIDDVGDTTTGVGAKAYICGNRT